MIFLSNRSQISHVIFNNEKVTTCATQACLLLMLNLWLDLRRFIRLNMQIKLADSKCLYDMYNKSTSTRIVVYHFPRDMRDLFIYVTYQPTVMYCPVFTKNTWI